MEIFMDGNVADNLLFAQETMKNRLVEVTNADTDDVYKVFADKRFTVQINNPDALTAEQQNAIPAIIRKGRVANVHVVISTLPTKLRENTARRIEATPDNTETAMIR